MTGFSPDRRRTARAVPPVLAMALVTLAIAAPAPAAATTRSEYVQQADPVCGQAGYQQSIALRGVRADAKHGKYRKAAGKFRRAFSILGRMVDTLEQIPPPAADATLIAEWLQSLRDQVTIGMSFSRSLARAQFVQVSRKAGQLQVAVGRSDALVSGFGFQYCVSSG